MIGKLRNNIDETGAKNPLSLDKTAGNKTAAGPGSASGTVRLTNGAKLLERLDKILVSLPSVDSRRDAVDSRRVAEIRSAIENGDDDIDDKAIADAMMRFE